MNRRASTFSKLTELYEAWRKPRQIIFRKHASNELLY